VIIRRKKPRINIIFMATRTMGLFFITNNKRNTRRIIADAMRNNIYDV
jgi:hypothetical protein